MSVKDDYICGTCKHWDRDNDYCTGSGNHEIYEEDTCEYWEGGVELSNEEKRDIIGDRKAHEIMEQEGHVE